MSTAISAVLIFSSLPLEQSLRSAPSGRNSEQGLAPRSKYSRRMLQNILGTARVQVDFAEGKRRMRGNIQTRASISNRFQGYSAGGIETASTVSPVMGCLKARRRLQRAVSQWLSRLPYFPSPKSGIFLLAN